MPRRATTPALKAPQTVDQARDLAARFAACDAELKAHAATAAAAIAGIKASAEVVMAPLAAELKAIVKQLSPWWAARHEELTEGKRRSIELGGCKLGYRLSNPKVTFSGGKDDVAAETLRAAELAELLRIEVSVDKPSILKAFAGAADVDQERAAEAQAIVARLRALGFAVAQEEAFFVEASTPPAPVTE